MSAFYDDAAATAQEMIGEFGQVVTLGAQSIYGAVTEYSSRDRDGTLIKMGDKKVLLSPMTTAGVAITPPDVDDTITLADASVWTIKAIDTLNPAGTPVLYTLQIRGSS